MSQEGSESATGMTLAAIVIGLSITDELSANDQNIVANLLFAAAQAIPTRASLLPQDGGSSCASGREEENTVLADAR